MSNKFFVTVTMVVEAKISHYSAAEVLSGVEKRLKGILDTDIEIATISNLKAIPSLNNSLAVIHIDSANIRCQALKIIESKAEFIDRDSSLNEKIISTGTLDEIIQLQTDKRMAEENASIKRQITGTILGLIEVKNLSAGYNYVMITKI